MLISVCKEAHVFMGSLSVCAEARACGQVPGQTLEGVLAGGGQRKWLASA